MSQRILVTGGAGFIGSHLCGKLVERGCTVFCVDNLFTGNKNNIAELMDNPRFTFIFHDVTNPLTIQVEQIYHLACPASPVHYQYNPIQTVKTNVIGTLCMLDLARTTGARILQASTSEVYGEPLVHPQPESYYGNVNPIGPRACYDEGKRVAETLCFDFYRQYGTDVRVLRLFNVYGSKMRPDDGRVVSNFIVQALKNEPITIYGDGLQTRSFCYVSDLIDGMLRVMNCDEPNMEGPFNIGNPNETSVYHLAHMILDLTGSRSPIVYKELPENDPSRRKPDIRRIQERVGWTPLVKLRDGLQSTIEYFRTLC